MTRFRKPLIPLVFCLFSALATGESERIHIPQFIGGIERDANDRRIEFRSTIHLVSLTESGATVRVVAMLDSGEPMNVFGGGLFGQPRENTTGRSIAGFGESSISTQLPMTSGLGALVGWASIETDAPIGVIVRLETLDLRTEEVITSTSLLPEPLTQAFSSYAKLGPADPRRRTGFAILNPSETESVELTFQLVLGVGFVSETRTLVLPARGKIAQFLDEGQLFTDPVNVGRRDFRGSVEVRSTGPVAVTVIRVDDVYWSAFPIFPPRPGILPLP